MFRPSCRFLPQPAVRFVQVSSSGGVRALLIHAKDEEAQAFYGHYGFVESPLDPLVMMMLLGDLS